MGAFDHGGEGAQAAIQLGRRVFDYPWSAIRAARLRRLGWRGADLAASLRATFEQELAERAGFQWLAVVFACGCLAYFSMPREPVLVVLLGTSAVALVPAIIGYRRGAT
jgi:hypothetical protein